MNDNLDWDNRIKNVRSNNFSDGMTLKCILFDFPQGVRRYKVKSSDKYETWYREYKGIVLENTKLQGITLKKKEEFMLSMPEVGLCSAWKLSNSSIIFNNEPKDISLTLIRYNYKVFVIKDTKEVVKNV